MQEHLLTEEHRMFRDAFRKFAEREIVPHQEQWEKDGIVSREVWQKAGAAGFLCMDVPEEYGGLGVKDYRYHVIVAEELARVGEAGAGFALHTDMIVPYITNFGSEAQKARWLPGLVSGELIASVAMSEPNTGSDLQGVQTTAVKSPDGSHYTVNGQKTFISNGILNDLVVVVAKTDPDQGARGISLIVLERGMEGYERGRNLDKIGMRSQDTAELYFKDVKVPAENLLGQEGHGFAIAQERLGPGRIHHCMRWLGICERAFELMVKQAMLRELGPGTVLADKQTIQNWVAESRAEMNAARLMVLDAANKIDKQGVYASRNEISMIKFFVAGVLMRVIDRAIQTHGAMGMTDDTPLAYWYRHERASRIYDGPDEVHKMVVARRIFKQYR